MNPQLLGNPQLVGVVAFGAVAFSVAAVGWLLRDLAVGLFGRRQEPLLGKLTLARDEHTPTGISDRIDSAFERLVIESGLDCSPMAGFFLLVCCGLLGGGATFVWLENPLLSGIVAIFSIMLVLIILSAYRARRMRDIQTQLPDMLDMLSRAVRAGESIDQAIELAGSKGAEPLAKEFRRCARHLEMGLAMPATMRALTHRVRLMDMRIFATTLSVHRQSGGNLATTLERLSQVVRDRLAYRRQLRAVTAAGRFSAILVASVGPILFAWMFLVQPEYARALLEQETGRMLLATAVVLELVGLIWVMRMMKADY